MRHCTRTVLITLILFLAARAGADGPKSIFDEDWTPPKRIEPVRPRAVNPDAPPAPVPPPVTVDAPKVTPADPTPTPTAPADRRAVPTRAQQAAVRRLLKEVFAAQLADRSAAARAKLARALLAQADKSAEAPVDQFVLLAAAVDAGTEAANLPLAFEAGERMARGFDVDALAIEADAARKLAVKPGAAAATTEGAAANVNVGLDVVDRLVESDDLEAAGKVCAVLAAVAGTDPALRAEVKKRQREVGMARDAMQRAARHFEKLRTSPDDPAANLEVGKYLCFNKSDWKGGLPALARGADAGLRSAAARDLAGPSDTEAQLALADAWWDLAQAAGPDKPAVLARAGEWYERAAPKLVGMAQAKAEKRLGDVAMATGRVVNLLPFIDVKRQAIDGTWKNVDGGGIESPATGFTKVGIRYRPPEEYDFRIEFTRRAGKPDIGQVFTHAGRRCVWVVGWDRNGHGFGTIDGRHFSDNATYVKGPSISATGQRFTSVVQVRKAGIAGYIDGKLVSQYKTDGQDLNVSNDWRVGDLFLALGTGDNDTVFHVVELRELGGRGKPIP